MFIFIQTLCVAAETLHLCVCHLPALCTSPPSPPPHLSVIPHCSQIPSQQSHNIGSDDAKDPMEVRALHRGLLFGEWMLLGGLVGKRPWPMGSRQPGPHDRPPPPPFIRAGLCCLFNSFICRNDCDYQSRAHRLTEEVKVAPQEDKPQKTILLVYMLVPRARSRMRRVGGFHAS